MFRKFRAKLDHIKHEKKDHTHVVISAQNKVEGHSPSERKFSARESIVNYESKTNADLVANFNRAAIQCGPMSENEMGAVTLHSVHFTVEGTINGHVIAKKELDSITALSELIKSCGVETNYMGQEAEVQPVAEQVSIRNSPH